MPEAVTPPPAMVELDQRAEHIETPCGEGTMKWRAWGSGMPVVLLHGAHGSWLHWIRNIPELSKHYRLLAADMPGFGDSAPIEPLDSPARHAEVVAEGLRRIRPASGPVDIVAFSAGALVACHLSLVAPELVRRIIMIDAGGLGTPLRTATFKSMRGLVGEEVREANRANLAAFMYHDAAKVDDIAIAMNMIEAPRMRSKIAYQVIPDKLLAVVRQVRAPIDLIWGEFDFPHPDPELNAEAVREFQPKTQLRVVRGAGHWSMGEQPEGFNKALRDLLELPPRPWLD